MRAYGLDLRNRVIKAKKAKGTTADVSKRFGISYSCVDRWWSRYKQSGEIHSYKIGGHKPFLLKSHTLKLATWIKDDPCITLDEVVKRCALELGIKVSRVTIWNQLDRMGLSFKKNATRSRARQTRRSSKA